MTELNGIFVKIFRDKEAWEQHKGVLETTKAKLDAEEDYRKKLIAETGIDEAYVRSPVNAPIDPKLFYPELDFDSPEHVAWLNGHSASGLSGLTKNEKEKAKKLGWPTEALEEVALFKRYRVFESSQTVHIHNNSGSGYAYKLVLGHRGNKVYLIAWWGEKEYYDQIQSKLAELEAERNNPAPCDEVEPNSPATIGVLATFAVVIWLFVGWFSYNNFLLLTHPH